MNCRETQVRGSRGRKKPRGQQIARERQREAGRQAGPRPGAWEGRGAVGGGRVRAHLQFRGTAYGALGQPSPGQAKGQGAEVREVALAFRILVFTWGRHCKQAPSLAHGRARVGWAGPQLWAPVGPTRPPVAWVVSKTHGDTWVDGDT